MVNFFILEAPRKFTPHFLRHPKIGSSSTPSFLSTPRLIKLVKSKWDARYWTFRAPFILRWTVGLRPLFCPAQSSLECIKKCGANVSGASEIKKLIIQLTGLKKVNKKFDWDCPTLFDALPSFNKRNLSTMNFLCGRSNLTCLFLRMRFFRTNF